MLNTFSKLLRLINSKVNLFQCLYASTIGIWCNFKKFFKFIQHLLPDLHWNQHRVIWSSEISLRVILLIKTLVASWFVSSILIITLMSEIKSDCAFPYRYQRHCQLQGSHETVSFQCENMCLVLSTIIIVQILPSHGLLFGVFY